MYIVFVKSTKFNMHLCFRKSRRTCTALGLSGSAMVLDKIPVPGRPTMWMKVGQGPILLAVGAGWGCLDIFIPLYPYIKARPRSAIGRAPDS